MSWIHPVLIGLYTLTEAMFAVGLLTVLWIYTRPIDWVRTDTGRHAAASPLPPVLLFYPVLHEAEETMRTTFTALHAAEYPANRKRIVAIPNSDDAATIAALERLQTEFAFLEVLPVPPTVDPSWAAVWSDWDVNTKAYWWHIGKRAGETALPPKKTRQLVYAFYTMANDLRGDDWLLSYIDADSAVPVDYFQIAAAGVAQGYDVIQLTNIAGNMMDTWASTFHAMDHLAWDAAMYPHLSAHGRQPFWVLGKGLFFKVSDLLAYGGFNPWLTIEDPEVGMRLWTNGKRLGVSDSPLIEEVPQTFGGGITQRKRWVAGFFQSLHTPLTLMGMTFTQRIRARLNFVPCLSLLVNAFGFPLGIWMIVEVSAGRLAVNTPLALLSIVDTVAAVAVLGRNAWSAWSNSTPVLKTKRARLVYLSRVNPLFQYAFWLLWLIPLAMGFWMFVRDTGLRWERTEKVDANHKLIRLGAMEHRVIDLTDAAQTDRSRVS